MRDMLLRKNSNQEVLTMAHTPYSKDFINQAVLKVLNRGDRQFIDVARELNVSKSTLRTWLAKNSQQILPQARVGTGASNAQGANPSLENKLLALQQTYGMSPEALNAWCRERGLFASQLLQWREEFLQMAGAASSKEQAVELRELKLAHVKLGADLRRKEKALAEAAALLVLQKKFQALYSDEAP